MIKHCDNCGKEFETTSGRKRFCSIVCKEISWSKDDYPDGSDYIVCKECGIRGKQLVMHIRKVHHMSIDEYCIKHNCKKYDLTCESLHKQISENTHKACIEGKCGWQKGQDNPSHNNDCKNGRRSAWSMNFKGYDGLTDEQKKQKIKELSNRVVDKMNANSNNPTRLDYFTSRGYSKEEAKNLLKERQSTFSLKKCILKYGEEEGRRVFEERQLKWQKTLNNKPTEEIERINKAKANQSVNIVAYSKISQELFDAIYARIKDKYQKIYYATLTDTKPINFNKNYEYEVLLEDKIHRYFLDFYIEDNNKVIEFDGDYWHGEKRGNQKRDKEREEKLKQLGFTHIFHVKECDYRTNPQKTINECIEFIRS